MTACSDLQSAGSTVVGQPFTPVHNSTLRFQFEPTTTRLLDRDGLFQALPGLQPSNQDQSKPHMRQMNLKTFRGLGGLFRAPASGEFAMSLHHDPLQRAIPQLDAEMIAEALQRSIFRYSGNGRAFPVLPYPSLRRPSFPFS